MLPGQGHNQISGRMLQYMIIEHMLILCIFRYRCNHKV